MNDTDTTATATGEQLPQQWTQNPAEDAQQLRNDSVVYVYPTVEPETVWVPIVSCIVLFPALVLTVVLLLRRRAIRARARSRITRKRDAVRYTQAANEFCKVKLQNYDGLETVQYKNGDGRSDGRRMNCSYTISTDIEGAGERTEATDREMSTFDLAEIVACGSGRSGYLHSSFTQDDIGSGSS